MRPIVFMRRVGASIMLVPILPDAAQACLRAVVWQHRLGRNVPEYCVNTLADPINVTSVRKSITQLARRTLEH